ncbi:hydroxymethylbutenyl pyrophosphate reductase [sediment metagenome]|uniref:Hydroxymethylbutenyl pyrophosphate reductase n=1 Tax=sediment metagenome TaxID=749907 RepID=D9PJE5_9ZZZZ
MSDYKEIYLARTQGFCAGVDRAVKIVDQALVKYGPPIYVYHEIVHNTHVVRDFIKRGIVFVEDIAAVPEGQHVILSAHGVSPSVAKMAKQRRLKCIDATCPLVKKIHRLATDFSKKGIQVILIGHKDHQELIGTAGYVAANLLYFIQNQNDINNLKIDPLKPVAYLTQTTLSVDETRELVMHLKAKFPQIMHPPEDNICFATQTRQDAVKELSKLVEIIIVCGSPSSSNSNRLRETGAQAGVESIIIDQAAQLDMVLLKGKKKIGISSGASVPWKIVEQLVNRIQAEYPGTVVHNLESHGHKPDFQFPEI